MTVLQSFLWGGADCVDLARRFGTPLYVVDESIIRARCAEVRRDFLERWPNTSACYASKAFLTVAMARIIDQEGLGLDAVSGGELAVAFAAQFPPSRVELHGSAKSERELRAALTGGVGRIIVDGLMELELIAALAAETGRQANVLFRIAPGVAPHTHAHITTGQTGSKFGLPIDEPFPEDAVRSALSMRSSGVNLKGFHFHIGSQIFDSAHHVEAVKNISALIGRLKENLGFETEELNFGGGFGVGKLPDVPGMTPHLPLRRFTDAMMEALAQECAARNLRLPAVTIEPGRWIAAEAGITLYSVETVKRLPGVTYVGVDGGMPDNPRPSLYQAEYEGILANKMGMLSAETVTVAGKCCETGDILIHSIALPFVERGDVLAVFNTGAYNFSMAGSYNRLPRPAVVLVKDGAADVIAPRRTEEDLLLGESVPDRMRR